MPLNALPTKVEPDLPIRVTEESPTKVKQPAVNVAEEPAVKPAQANSAEKTDSAQSIPASQTEIKSSIDAAVPSGTKPTPHTEIGESNAPPFAPPDEPKPTCHTEIGEWNAPP